MRPATAPRRTASFTAQPVSVAVNSSTDAVSEITGEKRVFRVDSGHAGWRDAGPQPCDDFRAPVEAADSEDFSGAALKREQVWLQLHAAELISRLQVWAEDLDAREAQLNARTAILEHRERQLRLHRQTVELELAEQKRSLEREIQQLRAAARRLAFE